MPNDDIADLLRSIAVRVSREALLALIAHATTARLSPVQTLEEIVALARKERDQRDLAARTKAAVYGALEQWTWTADPHPAPAPIPALAAGACPQTATTIPELAAAWLGTGQSTKSLGSGFWDISEQRACTPFTSCDPWQTDVWTNDTVLKVAGTGLQLTVDAQAYTVQPDGSFGDTETWGFMTPTCVHLWAHNTTPNPGGLAGGPEAARETVINHP